MNEADNVLTLEVEVHVDETDTGDEVSIGTKSTDIG